MSMQQTDTPVKVETIVAWIGAEGGYAARFNAALPGRPIDLGTIARAVAAFERTLDPGIAPFDRWVAGEEG
jgi:cytochrome c peroxidase